VRAVSAGSNQSSGGSRHEQSQDGNKGTFGVLSCLPPTAYCQLKCAQRTVSLPWSTTRTTSGDRGLCAPARRVSVEQYRTGLEAWRVFQQKLPGLVI